MDIATVVFMGVILFIVVFGVGVAKIIHSGWEGKSIPKRGDRKYG